MKLGLTTSDLVCKHIADQLATSLRGFFFTNDQMLPLQQKRAVAVRYNKTFHIQKYYQNNIVTQRLL